MELTTLGIALTATKTLRDLVTASKPDMERVRKTVIDLQVAVLDARERESALTEDTRRLEEELLRLRNWQKDLSEYQLENIVPGSAVLVHQPTKDDPERAHWLCQPCANAGKKSVLQRDNERYDISFVCPSCASRIQVDERGPGGQKLKRRAFSVGVVV